MDGENTRRRFLRLAGVGTGLVLAGCSENSASGSTTADAPTDAPTTAATTAAETETETETQTRTEAPSKMSTVFHFSESGASNQEHALANVANLLATDMVEMENTVLVANGKGIYLLTRAESAAPDSVRSLIDEGASFRACSNSMDALDVSEDELIDGVEVVPAGVGELTRLQAEGYAYIETP
jgi:intracellular sulfur oxidation DsrE/DsrF family protein